MRKLINAAIFVIVLLLGVAIWLTAASKVSDTIETNDKIYDYVTTLNPKPGESRTMLPGTEKYYAGSGEKFHADSSQNGTPRGEVRLVP